MSRQVYLLGAGLALVALAFAATEAALGPRSGVTEANVKRIRPGMTLAEVEAIFGGPADAVFEAILPDAGEPQLEGDLRLWGLDRPNAAVLFGVDGGVIRAEWVPGSAEAEPSPLARLRAWLGW